MKRWKNHIASTLFFIAFLISLYWWNRSTNWFETWVYSTGHVTGSIASRDSDFKFYIHTLNVPNSKFDLKINQGLRLRNRHGKLKLGWRPPQFDRKTFTASIGHPPAKSYSFIIQIRYWQIALFFLFFTAIAIWLERKISQRRLEN